MNNEFKFEIREEGFTLLFAFLQLLLARLMTPKVPSPPVTPGDIDLTVPVPFEGGINPTRDGVEISIRY